METIDNVMDEVQKDMATRYDAEFNKIRFYVDAGYGVGYNEGLKQGRELAKQDMIKMLQGDRS